MKALILGISAILTLSSCMTLSSSKNGAYNRNKVFFVTERPTRCQYISNISGTGTEQFEGNSDFTVPMAYGKMKINAKKAGGNVVYVEKAFQKDHSYTIIGQCYKCRTKKVRRYDRSRTITKR